MDHVLAEDIEPEVVDWLWRKRLPRGMMSILAGQPEQGKGLLCCLIAAELSREGHTVLYSAIEDGAGLMTRPRLEAAGADLSKVIVPPFGFMLDEQFDELARLIDKKSIDLVIIDPIAAHLAKGFHHSTKIRSVTNPLKRVLEESDCAMLVVDHAIKRVGGVTDPLQIIGGTNSGLPAACRQGYVMGKHPEDPNRRVMACIKSNLQARPEALMFEIDVEEIDFVPEPVPFLIYQEEEDFDPLRLFAKSNHQGKKPKLGRPPAAREAASEWLTNYLLDQGKPIKASVIYAACRKEGMTTGTLRAAASEMGVVRNPPAGGKQCTWELPAELYELADVTPEDEDGVIPGQLSIEDEVDEQAAQITDGLDLDDELAKLLDDAKSDDDE